MQINQIQLKPLNDKITILIEEKDYREDFEKALKDYSKKTVINGFRKGMAPKSFVMSKYGNSILAEQINELAQKELYQYIKEKNINLLGRPILKTEEMNLDAKANKTYEVSFEIGFSGDFEINLGNEPITEYILDFKDEMIEKEIENVKKHFAKLEDSNNPIAENDTIYVHLTQGTYENDTFFGWPEMTEQGQKLLLGKSKEEAFTASLFDLIDNEKFDIRKYLLQSVSAEEMSDEAIKSPFEVKITNIKSMVTPTELSEEQITQITRNPELKTLEDLKTFLKEEILGQYKNISHSFLLNDVYQSIIEHTDVPMPKEFLMDFIIQTNPEKYNTETIEKEFDEISKSIKWDIITNHTAQKNEIKVEYQELLEDAMNRYRSMFMQYGLPPQEEQIKTMAAQYLKDEKNARQSYESLLDTKILEFITQENQSKFVAKPLTEDEFTEESKRRQALRDQLKDKPQNQEVTQ
ncbi:MAG: hypothetical protein MUE53_00455 [Chitinophagales bacterium]|jgi:trigger factor|nr:hypothetical protein [Chitinophagales bacterium]